MKQILCLVLIRHMSFLGSLTQVESFSSRPILWQYVYLVFWCQNKYIKVKNIKKHNLLLLLLSLFNNIVINIDITFLMSCNRKWKINCTPPNFNYDLITKTPLFWNNHPNQLLCPLQRKAFLKGPNAFLLSFDWCSYSYLKLPLGNHLYIILLIDKLHVFKSWW